MTTKTKVHYGPFIIWATKVESYEDVPVPHKRCDSVEIAGKVWQVSYVPHVGYFIYRSMK